MSSVRCALAVACALVAVSEAFQTVVLGPKGPSRVSRLPSVLSKGGLRILRPASPLAGARRRCSLSCAIRDLSCRRL
jgi:hypothetical protein